MGKRLVANALPSTLIDDAFLDRAWQKSATYEKYTDILHPIYSSPSSLRSRFPAEQGCSSGGPFLSPTLCVTDFRPPFSFPSPTTPRLGGAFPRILSCVSFSSRGRGRSSLSLSSIPVYRSPRFRINPPRWCPRTNRSRSFPPSKKINSKRDPPDYYNPFVVTVITPSHDTNLPPSFFHLPPPLLIARLFGQMK